MESEGSISLIVGHFGLVQKSWQEKYHIISEKQNKSLQNF